MKERVINRSNNPTKDSFEINEEMFDKYLKYWEPPKKEEGILLAAQRIKVRIASARGSEN